MKSVGATLREARTKKGYTLEDLNARTRISLKNLTALEADDLSKIASPFTYRSFVKQVAEAVNVEYSSLADEVQTQSSSMPEPLVPGQEDATTLKPNQFPFPEPKRNFTINWTYSSASVLAVAALITAYYFWRGGSTSAGKASVSTAASPRQLSSPEPAPRETETAAPMLKQAAPPVGQSKPVAGATAAKPAASVAPGLEQLLPPQEKSGSATAEVAQATAEGAAAPAPADAPIHIELSAVEPTWLSIATDGKSAYTGMLGATETKVLYSRETTRIRTANAGGVNIIFNGRALGILGRRGQPRTFVFTPSGYEVVRGIGGFNPVNHSGPNGG